jgi:tetratricopeptide (TPR) repeat protein
MMIAALENAILVQMDCEKGEGPEIAKKYGVRGFPTFFMVNADGVVTGGLLGYPGPESWAGWVTLGVGDQRPIEAKKAAFEKEPTKELATVLANHTSTAYDFPGAVKYYQAARELDPINAPLYTEEILTYMYYGSRGGAFTLDQIVAEAQQVMDNALTPADKRLEVAGMVAAMAGQMGDPEKAIPFIESALTATEGRDDLAEERMPLEIQHALHVTRDFDKAVELKRKSLPEGWQEDPDQLNSFAWWCFENEINLEEAEALALKGAELATTDSQKANILDTAAEICNARGNCEEAIARIKQAIALDPEKEFFKEQLARFEKKAQEKEG